MFTAKAEIIGNESGGGYTVWTVWTAPAVDRPKTDGTSVTSPQLACRLAAAINAQKAYKEGSFAVLRDVNGKTYVTASRNFMGRRLNADLNKLGF